MTRIRVKTRGISNLYVLIIHAPGDRTAVAARFTSRRPAPQLAVGEMLRIGRARVRIIEIIRYDADRGDGTDHVAEVFTRAVMRGRRRGENVITLPVAEPQSVVTEFLRYHVLVRVFGGDPDAWLAHLRARGGGDQGDLRFVRRMRTRLRRDPALLTSIRRMVDATPFWRAAGA